MFTALTGTWYRGAPGSLLFDVSPLDPLTYTAVSIDLLAAAILASYLPALRADWP